jgi:hypothetical protein
MPESKCERGKMLVLEEIDEWGSVKGEGQLFFFCLQRLGHDADVFHPSLFGPIHYFGYGPKGDLFVGSEVNHCLSWVFDLSLEFRP